MKTDHFLDARWRAGIALACAIFGITSAGTAAITWEAGTLGNVFLSNETVRIPLKCVGNEVAWTVYDFRGNLIKQGRTPVTNGAVTLQPAASGRRGYFELVVTEKQNGTIVSEARTAYAVLSAFDATKVKNSPFGVQSHFAQFNSPDVMPLLAKAGIAHFRDEHFWESIERTKGTYTFPVQFTDFMRKAQDNRLEPIFILGWANSFYDYSAGRFTAPHTAEGREGFANYARALVRQYPQLSGVEIWNEFNAGSFVDGPAAANKPQAYAEILKAVYPAVKAERPDAKVLAGASVPVAHGFFRDLFEQGAMPYLDVITVHPYRLFPDGVQGDIAQLRTLIKSYNQGKEKPIWATEFSMNIDQPEEQYDAAVYLGQIVPLLLSENVARMYFYLNTDDTVFTERGLLTGYNSPRGRFTPHPTYVAYATLIRQLYNTTFHSRLATVPSTYVLKFMQGATPVFAMWAAQPTTLTLAASGKLSVSDLMGELSTIDASRGAVTFALSPEVQFVRGQIATAAEPDNPLLADALAGYSGTQGGNGWHYGTVASGAGPYDPAKFTPMAWKVWANDNYRWCGPSQYNFINVDQVHPTSAWTVRRWISTHNGNVALTGEIERPTPQGDGVDIMIFVNGVSVYQTTLAPGTASTYTVASTPVHAGSLVDFVVAPRAENSFDATKFTATITRK